MCEIYNLVKNSYFNIDERSQLHPSYKLDLISAKFSKISHEVYLSGETRAYADFTFSCGKASICMELKVDRPNYVIGSHLTQGLCYMFRDPRFNTLILGTQYEILVIYIDENKEVFNRLAPIFRINEDIAPSRYATYHRTPLIDFVIHKYQINKDFDMCTVYNDIYNHFK